MVRSRFSRGLVVALVLSTVAVAVEGKRQKYSAEQQAWMAARDAQPLDFSAPDAEAAAIWARAEEWIVRFSKMPMKFSSATSMQTEEARDKTDPYPQFILTRLQRQTGEWTFHFEARSPNRFAAEIATNMVHALAYYAASGIPYPN